MLRPDALVKKRYEVAEGRAQEADLRPLEEKAVAEVVKLQQECGFQPISSGEYTRYAY